MRQGLAGEEPEAPACSGQAVGGKRRGARIRALNPSEPLCSQTRGSQTGATEESESNEERNGPASEAETKRVKKPLTCKDQEPHSESVRQALGDHGCWQHRERWEGLRAGSRSVL